MEPVTGESRLVNRMTSHIFWVIFGVLSSAAGQTFSPVSFTLPSPPSFVGTLSPNYALYNVEKLHPGKTVGPTSYAFFNNNVYTVTSDRLVVNVASCPPQVMANLATPGCRTIGQCGQLMSIRVDNSGQLLVLDAYRGLYSVNPNNGAVTQLYSSTTPAGGRRPVYLNGMAVAADGTVLLSDSSDKYDASNDVYIIMEGTSSGRILAFEPSTRLVTVVVDNVMAYPNGLEITSDGTKLLVAESGRARILSVGLTPATLQEVKVFANNLPGMPGNIRRSSRNTFWVGISNVRQAGQFSTMDTYSARPRDRLRTVTSVPKETIQSYYAKYGLVIELDSSGRILGSMHDPTGTILNSISEVDEHEGLLYVGSPGAKFVGRIVLPQGDGRALSLDSVLQVLRSRCQVADKDLPRAKQVLQEYIASRTAQTQASTSSSQGQGGLPILPNSG